MQIKNEGRLPLPRMLITVAPRSTAVPMAPARGSEMFEARNVVKNAESALADRLGVDVHIVSAEGSPVRNINQPVSRPPDCTRTRAVPKAWASAGYCGKSCESWVMNMKPTPDFSMS